MRIKRHWRITAVLVTILLFVTMIVTKSGKVQEDQPLFPTIYKTYFPSVYTSNPFWHHKRTGMAWLYHPISDKDVFGATSYYHSFPRSHAGFAAYIENGGVPELWSDADHFYELVDTYMPNWKGKVFVHNEPDGRGQANLTPDEAVESLRLFRLQMPDATFIGPNISHIGYREPWPGCPPTGQYNCNLTWLELFLQAGGAKYIDIWSFHLYAGLGDNIYEQIDLYCSFLTRYGIVCENLIVSEWGSCDPATTYAMARMWIESEKIAMFYGFTNRGPWGCLRYFDENGIININGEALRLALLER